LSAQQRRENPGKKGTLAFTRARTLAFDRRKRRSDALPASIARVGVRHHRAALASPAAFGSAVCPAKTVHNALQHPLTRISDRLRSSACRIRTVLNRSKLSLFGRRRSLFSLARLLSLNLLSLTSLSLSLPPSPLHSTPRTLSPQASPRTSSASSSPASSSRTAAPSPTTTSRRSRRCTSCCACAAGSSSRRCRSSRASTTRTR